MGPGNWCDQSVFAQHNSGPEYLNGPTKEKKAATVKPQCFSNRTRGMAVSGAMNDVLKLEDVNEAQYISGHGRHCGVDYREGTRAIEQERHYMAGKEMEQMENTDPTAKGNVKTLGQELNSQTFASPVDIKGAVQMYCPLPQSTWSPNQQTSNLPLSEIHPTWHYAPGAGAQDGGTYIDDDEYGERRPRVG